jgi:hypothetical protein
MLELAQVTSFFICTPYASRLLMHPVLLSSYSVFELYDTPLAQESPKTANLKGELQEDVVLFVAWQASELAGAANDVHDNDSDSANHVEDERNAWNGMPLDVIAQEAGDSSSGLVLGCNGLPDCHHNMMRHSFSHFIRPFTSFRDHLGRPEVRICYRRMGCVKDRRGQRFESFARWADAPETEG